MKKECDYCGNEFEASRSDAKYCSKTCKNDAYVSRKANPDIAIGNVNVREEDTYRRNNRHNVQTDIKIGRNQFNSLVNSTKANGQVLNHLLIEKDNTGDIKALNSELRIELKFVERDLQAALSENTRLKEENEKMKTELEKSVDLPNRLMSFCEENPAIAGGFMAGIMDKFGSKKQTIPSTPNQ